MNKLLLTLILSRSKPKSDQGFSLFEVTIAILVSSAFLMGTLQAMTINAVMRVKSERQAQANFIIQQDVEKLQATASNMNLDHLKKWEGNAEDPHPVDTTDESTVCDPSSLNMEDVRFGAYLVRELDHWLKKDTDTGTKSDPAIDPNQVFTSESSTIEFNGKRAIVQIVRDSESLINKDYRLVRIMTVDSATSHQVLQVYYRVGEPYEPTDPNQSDDDSDQLRDDESGNTSIIAENYTEVIPAAVAECGFSP